MTENDIIESNKLIAEFMGAFKTHNCKNNELVIPNHSICRTDIIEVGKGPIINYHRSWDWLMPVVEKIEEIDVVASFQIEQPTIYIWKSSEDSTFKDIEIDIFNKSKIIAVYEAVARFIKWYNKSK